jgi:hypothetical protein
LLRNFSPQRQTKNASTIFVGLWTSLHFFSYSGLSSMVYGLPLEIGACYLIFEPLNSCFSSAQHSSILPSFQSSLPHPSCLFPLNFYLFTLYLNRPAIPLNFLFWILFFGFCFLKSLLIPQRIRRVQPGGLQRPEADGQNGYHQRYEKTQKEIGNPGGDPVVEILQPVLGHKIDHRDGDQG